jgi:hypothetical protein
MAADNPTKKLNLSSSSGGNVTLTLSGGLAQGPDTGCRVCLVKPNAANTEDVTINWSSAADATCGVLDANWCPMPVTNLSVLRFYSADANAIVNILYRN